MSTTISDTRLDQAGVTVWHPTDRPNFTVVGLVGYTFYVSYQTVVAFRSPVHGLVVCENVWPQTTGKHLNWIDDDKSRRVKWATFAAKYAEVAARLRELLDN